MDMSTRTRTDGTSRWTGYIVSASAMLISLTSLAVAISANRTQERLLAASVWPSLGYGTGNRGPDGTDVITLSIGNQGTGPARLRAFQVLHGGAPARDARALLAQCCGLGADESVHTVTSGTRAAVLKAGDEITLLQFERAANDAEVWTRFNRERFKVEVKACYCSVLDECWMVDTARTEPDPVASCPLVPDAEQWHG